MIYPISPGSYCVPSALQALTGADLASVIVPAINRHSPKFAGLHTTVVGVSVPVARAVLDELGYRMRAPKDAKPRLVRTWARMACDRWPGHAFFLVTTALKGGHALTAMDGRVYDSHMPHGEPGDTHPFAKCVANCYLVEKKR